MQYLRTRNSRSAASRQTMSRSNPRFWIRSRKCCIFISGIEGDHRYVPAEAICTTTQSQYHGTQDRTFATSTMASISKSLSYQYPTTRLSNIQPQTISNYILGIQSPFTTLLKLCSRREQRAHQRPTHPPAQQQTALQHQSRTQAQTRSPTRRWQSRWWKQ